MPLESASYIHDLVPTNPTASDVTGQGDDHLRLLKAVILATFPNFTSAALNSTQAAIDAAVLATGATGKLALALGSAALPTYSFTGETNTGIYSEGAGKVDVSIGGVLAAEFAAAGLLIYTGDLALGIGNINLVAGAYKLNGTNIFPLQSGNIGALQVLTAALADDAVTYAKLQNVAATALLGNSTGSAANAQELTLGRGLAFNGTAIDAPGVSNPGAFSKLDLKTSSDTAMVCSADWITVGDGTVFRTLPFAGTINFTTNGAVNALDTGTVAAAQWYAIWAIAKADGTLPGFLASLSFSAPTLPAGYTLKTRVGSVRTAAGNSKLHGIWQRGRQARYIAGLVTTTAHIPVILTGVTGTIDSTAPVWTSTAIGNFVPSTASVIYLTLAGDSANSIYVAPSNSYDGPLGNNAPPLVFGNAGRSGSIAGNFLLESTNIFIAANGAAEVVLCNGWEDNI